MKTKTRATKKQTVKPKAGAAKKSKRNGKSTAVPKIRMTRKLDCECDQKPAATPRATTQSKNVSGKAKSYAKQKTNCADQPKNVSGKDKSYAKQKTNCADLKRKFTTCIKAKKSHNANVFVDVLRECIAHEKMIPEQQAVRLAAVAYCVLNTSLRRRRRLAKLKKEGLLK